MGADTVFSHRIGGTWVAKEDQMTLRSPWDSRNVVGVYPRGTVSDAEEAVLAAVQAQKGWAKIPAPERARVIWRATEGLRKRKDEVAAIMIAEAGKTKAGADGEVAKTLKILEYCAGHGTRLGGFSPAAEQPGVRTYSNPRPLGVVAIVSPYNFPLAVPVWKLAPALIAGNAIVWKPSDSTPGTSVAIMKILIEAGVPDGVVNLVHGGPDVGTAFVQHPSVNGVSFTGSTAVGREIYRMAAGRHLDKVVCEMGGQNAVIVMDDADWDKAAADIVTGAFGAAGQRCTATSRVIADAAISQELRQEILKRAWALTPDWVGPLISTVALHHALSRVEQAQDGDGVELLAGGERIMDGNCQYGNFMQPTIFEVHDLKHFLWQEEIFGPVVAIHEVDGYDEAIKALNANEYGHAASLYTNDHGLIERFPHDVEVGMVHINEPTIGGEAHLGFGGMKATTIGPQEMGNDGLEFFSRRQTVSVNWGGAKISAGTR